MQRKEDLEPLSWSRSLLSWYRTHKRDLPWRRTRDPYAIWVSEIMLQQTQVSTVIPYYERWMSRFPTVEALARADEQDVLSIWQGLGYYRRCKMLLEGARQVATSGWPENAAEWMRVKGVGRYTAGAIASIAQGEPVPLVDGNVERVFARFTGCPLSGASLKEAGWSWAEENVAVDAPGSWNQALMELGATVCTPASPACAACPVARYCVAKKEGLVSELPRATPKVKAVKLEQVVWVPFFENRFGVRQIPAGEWWAGMWEFPRANSEDTLSNLISGATLQEIGKVKHSVTHHRIQLRVSFASCAKPVETLRWLEVSDLERLPMPSPQRKALHLTLAVLRFMVPSAMTGSPPMPCAPTMRTPDLTFKSAN